MPTAPDPPPATSATEVGARIGAQGRVTVERGDAPPRDLPPAGTDHDAVGALVVPTEGYDPSTVAELLTRLDMRSLVVLHRGRLAYEWYGPAGGPDRRNRCYSVTKSFTGTLAATAVHVGVLDRAARVGDLLPELTDTGFADASVGDVADMTVAIAYDEDYDAVGAPASTGRQLGFGDYAIALGLVPDDGDLPAGAPRSLRALLHAVGPAGAHGEVFAYATPVTDVLAWLLERATGRGYTELLAALWAQLGAEHDAVLGLDHEGTPVAAAGLSVTTRDLARFGLLLSEHGRPGAADVVPAAVVESFRDGGSPEAFARSTYSYLTGYTYRDQWWLPGGPSRPLSAWGIHGQFLWVEPDAEVVVAGHCAGALPSDHRRDLEQDALCRTLTAASARWP